VAAAPTPRGSNPCSFVNQSLLRVKELAAGVVERGNGSMQIVQSLAQSLAVR